MAAQPTWPLTTFATVSAPQDLRPEDRRQQRKPTSERMSFGYLAARGLALRLSYYRQRVENVASLEGTEYEGLENHQDDRDGGRFELLTRSLNDVYGGSWASFRVWRTDVDEEEDAPVLGPERADNTESEQSEGVRSGPDGSALKVNSGKMNGSITEA